MKINEKNGVKYITFDIYEEFGFLRHLFSTRIGGVSLDACESMNLSFSKDENPENVYENFRRLCDAGGISYDGLTMLKQVHGTDIVIVNTDHKGAGFGKGVTGPTGDSLITNSPGIALTTFYADCVPLYFLEPDKKIIALAHAGWKGTVNNIVGSLLSKMKSRFSVDPKNIFCAIGPAIGQCCFEVDTPVAKEFFDKISFSANFIEKKGVKYNIDLPGINKRLMIDQGIKEKNIETAHLCTKCNPELFFSHRLKGPIRGSMVGVMELLAMEDRIGKQ